jgi:hypothetical protein
LGKRERGEPSREERGTCVGVIGKMNGGMGWGLTGGAHHQAAAGVTAHARSARGTRLRGVGGSGWVTELGRAPASQPAQGRERGAGRAPGWAAGTVPSRAAHAGRGRLGRQKEEKGEGRVWGDFPIFPF